LEDGRRGDPESLLLWTSKSVRHLAGALRELGHEVHYTTVAKLMRLLGYSLQANVKTREGASHPDRDAQFGHINTAVKTAVAAGQPAISVDTKKKELVGDFKNAGREWRPKGEPELVRVHDFKDEQLGKAIPLAGRLHGTIGALVRLPDGAGVRIYRSCGSHALPATG
jgi:hypothetical protein